MEKKIQLKTLLLEIDDMPWNEYIYMSEDEEWSLDSMCYLFDLDELDDEEEDPKFALENGLICVLSISDAQDIIDNMKQQKENCSVEEMFCAYMYYYKNDAFISL